MTETYTKLIKLFPTQRELKGSKVRHWLKIIVILLSKSITQHVSLYLLLGTRPLGAH